MTAGKYRWMTVEEAEKELNPGEYVWFQMSGSGFAIAAKVIETPNGSLRFAVCGEKTRCKMYGSDRICRALVPEVPTTGDRK